MADKISKAKRSWLMSRVASKHTKPERLVRSLLHRLGYRFTVNGPKNKNLPGRPDIVLPSRKIAVFVHGCFWHRHADCKIATTPKSNTAYWDAKFARNIERDCQTEAALLLQGWQTITIWECELKQLDQLAARLVNSLPRAKFLNLPEDLDDQQLVAETQSAYATFRAPHEK
ncbi:DNA mismatch endonuclease Vsr [Pelagicoccus sp. SDUM812002]|uniref:very short patch repair endonuclease n=1 Tax=Pelagicoccus sp. SDUM812002 TaxID=3041266 RepID=UPI00280D0FBC|nr:DNA mismatch endonuclease Vsr [Pelagicoccus sp. SDUM812002]MDQ8184919.1 DNA mismatch endonuclease Vsr [Pelagicoccus sp. SDUM812002]